MKSLNAKRIAAIVTGAALLGAGLAFAGPLTIQNVPIISNSGQPVVQVVIGSSAKPSDGVAAGNIAAAIGNLAYTSTPVTAWVNPNSSSALKVSVSSSKYSLTNQQVWLNESGVTSATGSSYLFSALIGSVLNQGIPLGSPSSTKTLNTGTTYAFNRTTSTTASPISSPYATSSYVPLSGFSATQGGGVSFSTFTASGNDNILQASSSQFSSLASNWGSTGETEYLWLTGFPVFDAGSGVNSFALLSAGGAYEVVFGKPILNRTTSNGIQINQPIRLMGQNYSIIKEDQVSAVSGVSSGTSKAGSSLELASSVTPLTTVYVGHNLTSGPWTVQLQDLAQTTNGLNAPAAVEIYYNGQATNETSVGTGITKFNVTGKLLYLNVNSTFAGLYAYQKWAKMQFYTNVFNVTNGQQFNSTNDPGWYVNLLWTNTTTGTKDNGLYAIIIRNTSPATLMPGQSFSFIQNPSVYKLTFIGDTLGSNFDAVQISSQSATNGAYQNVGKGGTGGSATDISNITEPEQILQVTSQIPNAFSYAGQTSQTINYLLNPYELIAPVAPSTPNAVTQVVLTYDNPVAGVASPYGAAGSSSKWINGTQQLQVNIFGYNALSGGIIQENAQFSNAILTSANTVSNIVTLTQNLFNVTAIQIQGNKILPLGSGGSLTINVITGSNDLSLSSNAGIPYNGVGAISGNGIGVLTNVAAGTLYPLTGTSNYQGFSSGPSVIYNQQNGQPTTSITLTNKAAGAASNGGAQEYYTLGINEYPVPSSTSFTDTLGIGLFNATSTPVAQASPLFILNYSESGSRNNVTYIPTTGSGNTLQVQTSFRTEKGSKIASITPSQVTFDMATAIDQLQFALTTTASNSVISKSSKTFGPYSVGQATNLPNVSIAAVNATPVLAGTSTYSITGIANLTATPSVTEATTPVWLKNLSSTAPLVVLDSDANSGSNLILVGSGYVNSLSAQLESAYNLTGQVASGNPIVQAYGGNRILVAGYTAAETTSAANSFISQLYAQAASST